ncbi:MAG: integrase domain-containing protein [Sulfuricaulis sp.]
MFESTKPPASSGAEDVSPGAGARVNGKKNKVGAMSECKYHLYEVLKVHNHYDAEGNGGVVSYATSRAREDILLQGFKYLNQAGFKLRNVKNFSPAHMRVLAQHWEAIPLAPSTLQLRFSVFLTFCRWIGKKGMVGEAARYLKNPELAKRSYVAKQDKGWVAKGVSIMPKIAEAFKKDQLVGVQLLLMWAFGLRARESWQLHPIEADQVYQLKIEDGTKNGKTRLIYVRNDWQRQVITIAKDYINDSTGSLIPSAKQRKQWHDHFYYVCRSVGISRKECLVAHGLRHDHANELHKELSGVDSPVRGGAMVVDEALYKIIELTRQIVSHQLGHVRESITGAYCGRKPRKKKKDAT